MHVVANTQVLNLAPQLLRKYSQLYQFFSYRSCHPHSRDDDEIDIVRVRFKEETSPEIDRQDVCRINASGLNELWKQGAYRRNSFPHHGSFLFIL